MMTCSTRSKPVLLSADVGVSASTLLVEGLRQRMHKREFADAGELLRALRADLLALIEPVAQPLNVDTGARPFVTSHPRHT